MDTVVQFLLFFFNTLFFLDTLQIIFQRTVHTVPAFTQTSEYLKFFHLIPITQLKTDFWGFICYEHLIDVCKTVDPLYLYCFTAEYKKTFLILSKFTWLKNKVWFWSKFLNNEITRRLLGGVLSVSIKEDLLLESCSGA